MKRHDLKGCKVVKGDTKKMEYDLMVFDPEGKIIVRIDLSNKDKTSKQFLDCLYKTIKEEC